MLCGDHTIWKSSSHPTMVLLKFVVVNSLCAGCPEQLVMQAMSTELLLVVIFK
jgi:hypothetical protein